MPPSFPPQQNSLTGSHAQSPCLALDSLRTRADPQIDLAPYVGASLDVMRRDAALMRQAGPTLFTSVRHNDGVKEVIEAVLSAWRVSGAQGKGKSLPGKGKGKAPEATPTEA